MLPNGDSLWQHSWESADASLQVYFPIPGSGNFLVSGLSVNCARALCDLLRNVLSINTSGLSNSGNTTRTLTGRQNPEKTKTELPKPNYTVTTLPISYNSHDYRMGKVGVTYD